MNLQPSSQNNYPETLDHLVSLLLEMSADGNLDNTEIEQLQSFLNEKEFINDPKSSYLKILINEALDDGIITDSERKEITKVVLRMIPSASLGKINEKRESAYRSKAKNASRSYSLRYNSDQTGPFSWMFVRKWLLLGFIPKNVILVDPKDSSTLKNIQDDPRLQRVTMELESLINEKENSTGKPDSHPTSVKQKSILKELHWPFQINQDEEYFYVDKLIGEINNEIGYNAIYENYDQNDPDSPWNQDRYEQRFQNRVEKQEPATEAQIHYLVALGQNVNSSISKRDASNLIDQCLSGKSSVSNRQMMVLRFFGRVDIADKGKEAVSIWLDEWYQEDPSRKAAWDQWKERCGDTGLQSDPERVPINAYISSSEGTDTNEYIYIKPKKKTKLNRWIIFGIIVLLWIGLFKCGDSDPLAENKPLPTNERPSPNNFKMNNPDTSSLKITNHNIRVEGNQFVLTGKIINATGKTIKGATLRILCNDASNSPISFEDFGINNDRPFPANAIWQFKVRIENNPEIKHLETKIIQNTDNL